MLSFSQFDHVDQSDVFFLRGLDEIIGKIVSGTHQDLESSNTKGITIVVPVSAEILDKITSLMQRIDGRINGHQHLTIHWRRRDEIASKSLHITVYGIVKPNIYNPDLSWDWIKAIQAELQHLVTQTFLNFKSNPEVLRIEGLGIVGRGAINLRVSDNAFLDALRNKFKDRMGFSGQGRGDKFNKIVIGRIGPVIESNSSVSDACDSLQGSIANSATRDAVQRECDSIREALTANARRPFGYISLRESVLQVVHFQDEFLENRIDQFDLSIR